MTAEGCFFCRAASRRMDRVVFNVDGEVEIDLKYTLGSLEASPEILSLSIGFQYGVRSFEPVYTILEQVPRLGECCSNYLTATLMIEGSGAKTAEVTTNSTGSAETINFIKMCLSNCQSTHQNCSVSDSPADWYPTRLIEVVENGARLVVTAETPPIGPYASLSHRWGDANMLKCTDNNIDKLKQFIALSTLPTSFQNALHVIKFLGIKYIWIDSLCIIQDQDSGEDWNKESKTMMKVYQKGLLNLAATRSENGDMGLFAERNPNWMNSETIRIDNGNVKGDFQAVQAALDKEYLEREVYAAPLNTRGWVMQERLLSPRTVHFASEQVIWDCAGLTASETIPSEILVQPFMTSIWMGRKKELNLLKVSRERDKELDQWSSIVNAYSKCDLTFNTDKFTAISGAAEYMQHHLNDEYCAGLWRTGIELQLCWYRAQPQATRNDIAPSWSWASINGRVETPFHGVYRGENLKLLVTVSKVSVKRQINKGKGETYNGSLQMRCILNPVKLEGSLNDCRLTGRGMNHAVTVYPDTSDVIGAKKLYLVPIFEIASSTMTSSKQSYSEVRGILLKAADGNSGVFYRCGHAFLSSRTNPETGEFAASWLALFSAQGKSHLPCEAFGDNVGHLVNII
jgi:hypothetical protein